mmetsp:Transcript_47327/g.86946  ORF Transcript_47327/g.86946 Transcript_47327/m.86946 type:complete len:700 (+) Transcript_47327:130-2229(+)
MPGDMEGQTDEKPTVFCHFVKALGCCSQKSVRKAQLQEGPLLDADVEVQVEVEDAGRPASVPDEGHHPQERRGSRQDANVLETQREDSAPALPAIDIPRDQCTDETEQQVLPALPSAAAAAEIAEARDHLRQKCVEAAAERGRAGTATPRKSHGRAYKSSTSAGSSPKSVTSSTTKGSTAAQTLVGQDSSAPAEGLIHEGGSYSSDDLSWVTKERVMTLADVEARPKTAEQMSAPLAWVIASAPEADDEGSFGSESVTMGRAKTDTSVSTQSMALEATNKFGARVQVQLEDGWRDVPRLEFKQMRDHLLGGEVRFTIQARKAMYIIDFSSLESATQTNAATKKQRALRILDKNPNEYSDDRKLALQESNARATGQTKEAQEQERLGPQSKRGGAIQFQLNVLEGNRHAEACFAEFARREEEMCGEWAVFYHSYSFAALIYEVHAAFGKVLFKFNSAEATLPRILVKEFGETPGAEALMRKFSTKFATEKGDHHPEFRAVAISAMCSLVSLGPEASPPVIFIAGYSQNDLSFTGVLEKLLESCYVPKAQIKKLAASIIGLCEAYGLDVSQFGGQPCESRMAGHLLQIFIKRSLVDRLAYAAKPWGAVDTSRQPLSRWLNDDSNTSYGQARLVAHPKLFMHPGCVRMHIASADPKFHSRRQKFQEELTKLLDVILGDPELRKRAVAGIHGGTLPTWWVDNS